MVAADPTIPLLDVRSTGHAQDLSGTATKWAHGDFVTYQTRHGASLKMNSIIYLVGIVVVVLAILSFFGLR
jgi:hypothetical protein